MKVDEPKLSPQTNERLTAEVREVVGDDHVTVPADRPRPSRGEALPEPGPRLTAELAPNRFIMAMIGGSSLVIGAIVALVIGHWWILPVAFVVLGVVTATVVAIVLRMTSNQERPSATTVAALEEDGVGNPERHFSELVKEFTPEPKGEDEHRTTAVEDDAAKAGAEQETAITPSGGPSEATGPGD
ncbi:MAG: hypothetical protein WAL22_21870 [Solirubrobacteraceae bacterium]